MRPFVLPAVYILLAFASSGVAQTKYAVVVGIDQYEDEKRLPKLNYAEADAKVLADTLRKAGFKVTELLGREATKTGIESTFAGILKGATGRDSLLFAFAGHGQQFTPKGEKEDVPFLCTSNCNAQEADTQVRLNALLTAAGDAKVGRALFLIDACRTDPGARSGVTGNAVNLKAQTEVLFAAANGQKAREHEDAGGKGAGHGLFMSEVIAAFRGEAKNKRGEVTWNGLVSHITNEVTSKSKTLFPALEDSQHQTPHKLGSLVGDVVLAATPAGDVSVVPGGKPRDTRLPLPPQPTDGLPRARVTAKQVGAYIAASGPPQDPVLGVLTQGDVGTILDRDDVEKMIRLRVKKNGKEREVWVSESSVEILKK